MLDRLIQLCIENKARLTIIGNVVNVFIDSKNFVYTCVEDTFEDNVECCIEFFGHEIANKFYDEMTDTYF